MERDIHYVIAVAECGSISQAAEVLYISQPSLSRYLSSLENDLGVNLFIRTINGTELTEAGKLYVEYAKEIKRLRSTMKMKLREMQKAEVRRIRIGMTLNAISLSAFNVAAKVKAKYPDCEVELFNLLSKDIPATLKEGKYDFAIGPDLGWPQELIFEKFYQDPLILVVPDRYDIESFARYQDGLHLPLVDLRRLPQMDYILQDETTAVRKEFDQICRNLGFRIEPKMEVTSSTIAIQAAENQMGCCVAALGHLAFLNNREKLRFYQISDKDYSAAGVIRMRGRKLLEEEKYCISCIKKAMLEGEQEILKRIRGV